MIRFYMKIILYFFLLTIVCTNNIGATSDFNQCRYLTSKVVKMNLMPLKFISAKQKIKQKLWSKLPKYFYIITDQNFLMIAKRESTYGDLVVIEFFRRFYKQDDNISIQGLILMRKYHRLNTINDYSVEKIDISKIKYSSSLNELRRVLDRDIKLKILSDTTT